MLILTRKPGESLYIGDHIKVTVVEVKGNQIRVGIDAPHSMKIYREEIYRQILEENQQAAVTTNIDIDSFAEGFQLSSTRTGGQKSGLNTVPVRKGARSAHGTKGESND